VLVDAGSHCDTEVPNGIGGFLERGGNDEDEEVEIAGLNFDVEPNGVGAVVDIGG
jgi:hypothetical protein